MEKHRRAVVVLVILCAVTTALAALFATLYYTQHAALEARADAAQAYPLLDPNVAALESSVFEESQALSHGPTADLRTQFTNVIDAENGTYSVYFEDLNSGEWIGVNEKMRYQPRSLFKVPVLIAVLKKIESGDVSFTDVIPVTTDDIQQESTFFTQTDVGTTPSVRTLLTRMIHDSDNTALHLLVRTISDEDLFSAYPEIGVQMALNQSTNFSLSPKDYAGILRSLYRSQDLPRNESEYALSLMTQTRYNDGLPAGVPNGTIVAHKIGADDTLGMYHDCGIIYYPGKPYILCMMSMGTTQDDADRVARTLSNITYQYEEAAAPGN